MPALNLHSISHPTRVALRSSIVLRHDPVRAADLLVMRSGSWC